MRFSTSGIGGVLARFAGPLAVAVAAQSIGNLAFHALVGRHLDAGAYGALGAVLAAMMMLGIPLGALQTAASAHVAVHGLSRATLRRALAGVTVSALPAALLTTAGAPLLRDYFHLASTAEAAVLAPYLVVAVVLATVRGLLLGVRQVTAVAWTYLVSTVLRFALGAALVGPLGVSGALLATLAGEAAAIVAAGRPLWRAAGGGPGLGLRLGDVGGAAFAVTGLFLFSTVDLLLARHYLAGTGSGAYVAAATVAKTVLALPAAIMSAVFPRLVDARSSAARGRRLAAAAAGVAGPALFGAAVVLAAPGLILRVLYGDGYLGATGLVRTLAAVAGLTSVVTLMTNAALARGGRTTMIPWCGAALEVAFIAVWHGSAGQIAACSAAALVPTLALIVVVEGRFWRAPAPAPAPTGAGPFRPVEGVRT